MKSNKKLKMTSSSSSTTPKRRMIKTPNNNKNSSRSLLPSKSEFLKLVAVVSIAVSVAIGCNYVVNFFNRHPKPFCNTDMEFDYDVCDPCPSHGICNDGILECMSGYIIHGRSCLEDGEINEMAKNLAKMAESHACESFSQYLCNGNGNVWVREDGIWSNVDKGNATYLYAKQKAMEIINNLLETRDTSIGSKELKCPDLLVEHYKPLGCCLRIWLLEHALFLVPFCVLLMGCGLMMQRVRRRHYLSLRAEELYEEVCDMLEETALISRSVNGEGEPWIVASWLRDHILTPKERRDPLLWKKVEELVQEDSRLDRYPKMLKGEPKVVWEWQVEGSLRSSGKEKKKSNIKKLKTSEESILGSNQDHRRLVASQVLNFVT